MCIRDSCIVVNCTPELYILLVRTYMHMLALSLTTFSVAHCSSTIEWVLSSWHQPSHWALYYLYTSTSSFYRSLVLVDCAFCVCCGCCNRCIWLVYSVFISYLSHTKRRILFWRFEQHMVTENVVLGKNRYIQTFLSWMNKITRRYAWIGFRRHYRDTSNPLYKNLT